MKSYKIYNILKASNYYYNCAMKKVAELATLTGLAIGTAIGVAVTATLRGIQKAQEESGLNDNLKELIHNFDEYMYWSKDESVVKQYMADFNEIESAIKKMSSSFDKIESLSSDEMKKSESLLFIEEFIEAATKFEELYFATKNHIEEQASAPGKFVNWLYEVGFNPYKTDTTELIVSLDDTYKELISIKPKFIRELQSGREQILKAKEQSVATVQTDKTETANTDELADEEIASIKI